MTPIKTNCPRDCYDGCGMLVEPRDGGRFRVLGDPDHPVSRGKLCSKCALAYNGVWQEPSARLLHPLKRSGPRGSGAFTQISWDEALNTVADRMTTACNTHGAQSILHTHYSGTLALLAYLFPNRLFRHLGCTEVDPDTICNAAGHTAWTLMFGSSVVGFDPRTIKDTACVLVWGANPSHSAPHAHEHWLGEAPGPVIVVDPIKTETARRATLHLQPRPGSDAALAFSLLHCLQRDGKFDRAFIADHTVGFEQVASAIASADPAWGERQTGIPAGDIERAAAWYGSGPALLWCGQGLQRQKTGGNIMRAVGLLPALTGNLGKPGAGISYLNVAPIVAGLDLDWLGGGDLARSSPPAVSHMHLAERLEASDEFQVFFIWNTNPLASAPAQHRLRRALAREDLFVVASDVFMTDSVRHADIVLPAASFLEFDDLTFSYFHLHMGSQTKIREPLGESLPNTEIFRRLAGALQLSEPALFAADSELLDALMRQWNPGFDYAELQRRGFASVSEDIFIPWSAHCFDTPSGRIEIASQQAQEMGLPPAPQPWADAPPPHGHYRLLTPASRWRLNDSYANDDNIAARSGPASVHLSPSDAEHLECQEGTRLRLHNASGELVLVATIDTDVQPGTLLSYKGRWPLLEPDAATVNHLHIPQCADMGNSTSVHSTLVEVSLA